MALVNSDNYFKPKYHLDINATRDGYINYHSTKVIGLVSFNLGAGRLHKEDAIDYHAGVYLHKVSNEYAKKGETIATLYSSKPIPKSLVNDFTNNLTFNTKPSKNTPIIIKVMK
jgi:thymidine phosphorylase